jgi:hypothetical protein
MLSMLIVVAVVVAVGTRAADGLEVRQQEVILANLPAKEAVAYYAILRRRVRRIAAMRVIALLSLLTLFYSYKHSLAPAAAPRAVVTSPAR